MKHFLFISIIVFLVACNGIPNNTFKLEGYIENAADSETIILYYNIINNNELHEIADTAKIINGKFEFEGKIDGLTAADLVIYPNEVPISSHIYLEPTSMKIQINKNQAFAYKLSGTKVEKESLELRKALECYEKVYYEGLKRMDDIFKQIKLNVDKNNLLVLDSLFNLLGYTKEHNITPYVKIYESYHDFILKHNTYKIVPDLIYLITKAESLPIDTIKSLFNDLPYQSKTSSMGKIALKQIEYLESEKETESVIDDTLKGKPAPDFTRRDFLGKTIRLSDFNNKNYVLLDFWASWCIPCIKEIPKIKNLYDQYNEKGLMIISISCDKDNASWLNAINRYQLEKWPQILSIEDKNDTDDIFLKYNVSPIPHFILIDKQGIIIERWSYLGEEQLNEIEKALKWTLSRILCK